MEKTLLHLKSLLTLLTLVTLFSLVTASAQVASQGGMPTAQQDQDNDTTRGYRPASGGTTLVPFPSASAQSSFISQCPIRVGLLDPPAFDSLSNAFVSVESNCDLAFAQRANRLCYAIF